MTDVNVSNITPPRVAFLDEMGLISRPWFMWLLNMFARTGAGADTIATLTSEVDGLSVVPVTPTPLPPQDYLGPVATTPNPTSGVLESLLVSVATAAQSIPNTDDVMLFDTDLAGSFGSISRSGNTFIPAVSGDYVITVEPQMRQNTNAAVTSLWMEVNGTATPGVGARFVAAVSTDSCVCPFTFAGPLVAGDVVEIHCTCSINNGASLQFTAAGAIAPDIVATRITLLGYKP